MREQLGLTNEAGFTLVEFLVSITILATAITMVAGVLFAAGASSKVVSEWGDLSEQLRISLSQLGEDLTYGQWCSVCQNSGQELTVQAYQQRTDLTGWNPTWSEWPGWIKEARTLRVHYVLDADQLVREVYDANNANKIYSHQILATGLIPYSDGVTGSFFSVTGSTSKKAEVELRTLRKEAGVNSVAEVGGQWLVR